MFVTQVSSEEVEEILSSQNQGPIVHLSDSHEPRSMWSKFLQLKEQERLRHMKRMVGLQQERPREQDEDEDGEEIKWSWRKLLKSVFGAENKKERGTRKAPDSYNLYNRNPDFKNNYGWSIAVDDSDYSPLRHSGIGVYLVNLTAVSKIRSEIRIPDLCKQTISKHEL